MVHKNHIVTNVLQPREAENSRRVLRCVPKVPTERPMPKITAQ